MKKIYSILLIGLLSMFFAEVFSGASTMWFLDPWGIFLTLPLYMFHVLFFLWIAMEYKKISIYQLYLFGMIFALYEAWITKVLWAGYMDSAGPGLGTFMGIAVAEYSILVFFWHPVMSFLVPILVFQVLTGRVFSGHEVFLRKSRRSLVFISIAIILLSNFIGNGNSFNIFTANISVIGTLLLVFLARKASMGSDISSLHLKKKHFLIVTAYLLILYIATFFALLPEKLPVTVLPYASIILSYVVIVGLLFKLKPSCDFVEALPDEFYSAKDVFYFSILLLLIVNFACLLPSVSTVLLTITYLFLVVAGPFLFMKVCLDIIRKSRH
nr:hypothetical protein [uncultured Methanolobus sp.]